MTAKRQRHTAAFQAQVAPAALKGDRSVNETAGHFGVHPTLIHGRKKHRPRGAAAVFAGPPGRTPRTARWSCSSKSAGSTWSRSG
jgi:transposase-like protein